MKNSAAMVGRQNRDAEVVSADWLSGSDPMDPNVIGFNVKSTASETFDPEVPPTPLNLSQDTLIDEIVKHLGKSSAALGAVPHILVQVHGFNNPPDVSLVRYQQAFETLKTQKHPAGLVYLGYDWPSEQAMEPGFPLKLVPPLLPVATLLLVLVTAVIWAGYGRTSIAIAYLIPAILGVIVFGAIAVAGKANAMGLIKAVMIGLLIPLAFPLLGMTALFLMPIVLLLRGIVYFRDQYRAIHYGVVDLVDLLRKLDYRLKDTYSNVGHQGRDPVRLSFIGHSMGAFVTVNIVRILTDVFNVDSIATNRGRDESKLDRIGNTLKLQNLVLVSPDLPTENVLSGRSNYVASSLHRFSRCFLFSNEADEVVNLISGTAHSFSLPYRTSRFGVRLANLSLFRENKHYGCLTSQTPWSAGVWTTKETLATLDATQHPIAEQFTILDCTDATDVLTIWRTVRGAEIAQNPSKTKRVLSPRLSGIFVSNGHINMLGHFLALSTYIWRYDLHSGYFDARFIRETIFGVAASSSGWMPDCAELKDHQIAMLQATR
ncbi:MAG: hypothetical protein P4L46_17420 [Fimbriimonas sp.]|nr:hypothetical protein [Fimbriimonas sp.]